MAALCALCLGWLASCEPKRSGGEDQPAPPGLTQAGANGGALVDEDVACERLRTALVAMDDLLRCKDVSIDACPELVRPAGSAACTRFSERSVESCELAIADYDDCEDFETQRCLLTSELDERSEDCVVPGELDAGPDAGALDAGDAAADGGPATDASTDASTTDAGHDDAMAPILDAAPPQPADGAASHDR